MKIVSASLFSAALITVTPLAQAADQPSGVFVGLSAGAAGLESDALGLSTLESSSHANGAGKVSIGYWFNQTWGVEASYVSLGRIEQTYNLGTFRGKADSYAVSLLGRVALSDRWSLVGKLNLAHNRMKDNGSTPGIDQFERLRGSATSLVFPGVEVNYRINEATTVLFELDSRGQAADGIATGYAGFGVRYQF
ncbi:MAG: outer membrane beta-barrel protein [Burkholderiaceae bacterium]